MAARKAASANEWKTVGTCARAILKLERNSAEGNFLLGIAEAAGTRSAAASRAFRAALTSDRNRYDAAIELARLLVEQGRHSDAIELLRRHEPALQNSPYYLEIAATLYTRAGLHDKAWFLLKKACDLQPEIDHFQASLAACSVLLGKVDEAQDVYTALLSRHPNHQRNHYELSRLVTAKDGRHIEQMKSILDATKMSADRNIFLYYAIAKELEDLEQWDESFRYYEMAGNAVASVANYDVTPDVQLIDTIVEVCDEQWLSSTDSTSAKINSDKTPIFIVGLPRTGTTLTERIVSSHSMVESVDETFFMQVALKRAAGIQSKHNLTPAIVASAAAKSIGEIAEFYLESVDYKLGSAPYFIEKLPENFLCVGFIAKAFPNAKIVQLTRHPMDACFAMYKQSFFRFAYTLDNLGAYYVAHDRLRRHWELVLQDRLITVNYESLAADPEGETRLLLARLGLPYEEACLRFYERATPSATASAAQIREKVHSRSVHRWLHFEANLRPLQRYLEKAGVSVN